MKIYSLHLKCSPEEVDVLLKFATIYTLREKLKKANLVDFAVSTMAEIKSSIIDKPFKTMDITFECTTEQFEMLNSSLKEYMVRISQLPNLKNAAADMAILIESLRNKIVDAYEIQKKAEDGVG
jgi:predicted DNA-binding protein (MmcQ/YjbR family)